MNTAYRGIVAAFLGVSLLFLSPRTPFADEEGTFRGLRFACAGISKESRGDPRWQSYALKISFAAGGGGYLADVDVTIRDGAGDVVLEVNDCLAPWVLADLAPGSYEVTGVVIDKYTKNKIVKVSGGRQTAVVLRYPEITQ